MAGIAADMGHEDIDILDAETIELREGIAHVAGVHIAEDSAGGFELAQGLEEFETADIACMPDLIDVFEMLQDAFVE